MQEHSPAPDTAATGLVPPQNIEAERAVLGTVLTRGSLVKVIEVLRPEDFYHQGHRLIYQAMLELFERNEPQDLVTVKNRLAESNLLERAGGAAYLASLTTDVIPLAGALVHHAGIVRRKSILRRLIATCADVSARCYAEQGEVDQLVDEAEQAIFEITQSKSGQSYEATGEIAPRVFKRIEALYNRKEHITGVSSGYTDLDRMTAGFQPGDLIILAGRPSMGKTALAMNMVQHAALLNATPVAVFSLEMSKESLVQRMLCSVARIDSQRMRTGRLREKDWPHLVRATAQFEKAPIYIDDTPALTALEMRAKARRLKAEFDIGMVVVDYLQLMQGRARIENRAQEISEISRALKAMAKELDVPVVALSQLNRSLESRTDKRPQLSDLRESGAIEQDADVIIFIYRDEVYNTREDNPNRGIAEIIVGKQRNGPTGTIKLTFIAELTTFENYTSVQEPADFAPAAQHQSDGAGA